MSLLMRIVQLFALVAMSAFFSTPASAQARAWLDRERIALDETATLNIEAGTSASPDYAPLFAQFDLSGHSSRQQFEWTNGRLQTRSVYTVVLRPRGVGMMSIPALRVGSARTAPLTLLVTAPPTTRTPFARGRDAFIESEADDQDPYVQQAVGWTVRLYARLPLVSGRLDQDAPPGASLQRVGDDVQYSRTLGGDAYQVIERRYLLIPERSGELAMPAAKFSGRAVGNVFDRIFGDGQMQIDARAAPRVLKVRPIPAGAPTPWLPLHAVSMEYTERPQAARVGEASTLVVQVLADGASRSQMPELVLPAPDGAQVFADRAQVDEAMLQGRPRVRITRRFSIVPSREGALRIEGPQVAWWDVRAGQARTTRMPPIELVAAQGAAPPPSVDGAPAPPPMGIPASADAPSWRWLVPLGVLGAVLLLGGALARGATRAAPEARTAADAPSGPSLARALAMGDLADIEAALRVAAPPGVQDLDALAAALADDAQTAAVVALRQARWAGGDPRDARARLAAAFAAGPRWRTHAGPVRETLPPLYPEH